MAAANDTGIVMLPDIQRLTDGETNGGIVSCAAETERQMDKRTGNEDDSPASSLLAKKSQPAARGTCERDERRRDSAARERPQLRECFSAPSEELALAFARLITGSRLCWLPAPQSPELVSARWRHGHG